MLGRRWVLQYFLNCFACQSFWTAAAIYALTRGVTDPAAWFFTAAAYSGAAVILAAIQGSELLTKPQPPSPRCTVCVPARITVASDLRVRRVAMPAEGVGHGGPTLRVLIQPLNRC